MNSKRLIIIGASGHGKVVADIAEHCGYKDISFLDDSTSIRTCMGYPVVGTTKDIEKFADTDFFVAVGNAKIRRMILRNIISEGKNVPTLIHPKAVIASNVTIGKGTVVMAGAVINPDSEIGEGCIVNTGATVDHDNQINNYIHVSVGSHLAGTVTIGQLTWIGAGAVVSNNINICGGCMIGAGAVVIKDINVSGTYAGVPARKIKETYLD